MDQFKLIPRISFKGVFIFLIILFGGMMILTVPFEYLRLPPSVNYFLSGGISATIGMALVLTKIDGKKEEQHLLKKRLLLAVIIGFSVSALMTFVFGNDVIQ